MRIGPLPMIRTFIDLAPSARRHAQGWWSRSSRQSRSSLGSCFSQVEPPAAHRHAAAADTNSGHGRAGSIYLDVEDARASDFEALLDADARRGLDSNELVGDDVSAEGALRSSGRRVLSDAKALVEHAAMHL